MNCQEVQLQFSAYLEKSLDAIRTKGIETHLASCPFCRAEARGLSDCIDLVRALPLVEPPAGFSQRVMAHAREMGLEVPLWQRLVAVLRTTAPIQATAVLLVGVLAILVYQKEPRFRNSGIADLSAPPAVIKLEPEAHTIAPVAPVAQDRRDTAVNRVAQESLHIREKAEPSAKSVPVTKREKDSNQTSPAQASAVLDPAPEKRNDVPVAARRRPIQAQEISTGREPVRPNIDPFGFGAGTGALNHQLYGTAPFSGGRALSPLSEPSPDFEFIVRRRGLERREAEAAAGESARRRSETDAAIAAAAAQRAVPTPGSPSSSIVEIRWFTVAPHHLDAFRKDLAAEANIDSEKESTNVQKDLTGRPNGDQLLIKVVILPSEH